MRIRSDGPLWELHFLSTIALVGIFRCLSLLYPVTAPALLRFTGQMVEYAVAFLVTLVFEYSIGTPERWPRMEVTGKWAAGVKLCFSGRRSRCWRFIWRS